MGDLFQPTHLIFLAVILILLFGGKKLPELDALTMVYHAVRQGAAGVDMGRNIFQSEAPLAMLLAVARIVHEGLTPAEAFECYHARKEAPAPAPGARSPGAF